MATWSSDRVRSPVVLAKVWDGFAKVPLRSQYMGIASAEMMSDSGCMRMLSRRRTEASRAGACRLRIDLPWGTQLCVTAFHPIETLGYGIFVAVVEAVLDEMGRELHRGASP